MSQWTSLAWMCYHVCTRGVPVAFATTQKVQKTKGRVLYYSTSTTWHLASRRPAPQLRFIEADPVRIKECGRHLVWIVDEETNEKIDFVLFKAFSEEHLKLMMAYHKDLTKVQPVVRGQQFNYYTHGKMFPFGTRHGSGGGDGDALRMYEGISADTIDELNCMFNYAEEMLILIETTRAIFPALARDMKESTDFADRLGLTGCHLYKCFNFTSGIHRDRDRTLRSICAQLFLQAKKWEYTFVRLEYRLCVRPQSNTLWSFDGAKGHCCFQPSTEDLTEEECVYLWIYMDATNMLGKQESQRTCPHRESSHLQLQLAPPSHPPSPVRDKDHAGPNRPISSAGRKVRDMGYHHDHSDAALAQYQISMVRDPLTDEVRARPKPPWLLSLEKRGAVVEVEVRPGGKNGATVVVDGKDVAVVKEKEALTSLGREELLDDRIVNGFRRHHVGLNPSWTTSQSPNDAHAADTDAGRATEKAVSLACWVSGSAANASSICAANANGTPNRTSVYLIVCNCATVTAGSQFWIEAAYAEAHPRIELLTGGTGSNSINGEDASGADAEEVYRSGGAIRTFILKQHAKPSQSP
ncbi:hypothetical protein B0H13DRAFT_2482759 [Mycena leptocephala]|nr:hypothetical protein B0H13DRAFT_2482759 [Mycena leptocephala]